MQFEYDPERLMEEVKKRPGIWDFEHIDYRTKHMRCKLWSEVVNELVGENVKISKSERRELELQLQKKWKSLRDCFQKYLINPNRTRRPYIYSKQLQFLLKEQKLPQQRPGTSDSDDQSPAAAPIRKWKRKKKLKLSNEEEQSSQEENEEYDNNDEIAYSNDGVNIIIPPTNKLSNRNSKPIEEFAFANVDFQTKNESEDCDKMFLLSLLPHLKSIPEEFRLNVKMELMQVLQNANYNTKREHKII